MVDASLRDSWRCSVQSSCVPIVPPLGRRKIFESTDRPSGSSVTTPSGRRASLPNSSTVRLSRPRARRSSSSSRPVMALEISARLSPYISRKRSLQKTTRFCALVIITPWLSVVERGADECAAPQLGALGPAQRRQHPDPDRDQEGNDGDAAEQELPDQIGIESRRYSSPAQSPRKARQPTRVRTARQWRADRRGPAPESNSSVLPASSCQPLPTRGFAGGVSGLTGLDRVNDYPCNSKMRPKLRQLA